MSDREKTEQDWRRELSPEQYAILREKGTEPPFSGEYDKSDTPGVYRCAGCGTELFRSAAEVRLGDRLAELLRACVRRHGRRRIGSQPRDGTNRGALCDLRRPPSGMCSQTDRAQPVSAIASTRSRSISSPRTPTPTEDGDHSTDAIKSLSRRAPISLYGSRPWHARSQTT